VWEDPQESATSRFARSQREQNVNRISGMDLGSEGRHFGFVELIHGLRRGAHTTTAGRTGA
jgi:hypothetical protein